MAITENTREIIEGAAILVPFLILVFIASRIMARINTSRYNKAFTSLVSAIDGTLMSDGLSSMMSGRYGGRSILVSLSREVRSMEYHGHSNTKRNILLVEMSPVAGVHDWAIRYRSTYGIGREEWHTSTAEEALKAKLSETGAVAEINGMGIMAFASYSSNQKTLTYHEDIHPAIAPTPHRFQVQLDLLEKLAAINERVNVAEAS